MKNAAIAGLIALLLAPAGCTAGAALGGAAYIGGRSRERKEHRLRFLVARRHAGLSDREIIEEIRRRDPEWHKEIMRYGGKLAVQPRRPDHEQPHPGRRLPR